jgi:hypothetical protein
VGRGTDELTNRQNGMKVASKTDRKTKRETDRQRERDIDEIVLRIGATNHYFSR